VKAPASVELEIRTVWQEDDMPAEVTADPGYRSFTLGPDAQEWVDSMAEVVDGNNAVYGRPKPVVPTSHRSLASTNLPAPASPVQSVLPLPPAARVQPQPARRRIAMPEIAGGAPVPVRTLPPRTEMPEIGGETPAPQPAYPGMPEIGGDEPPKKPTPRMPEIG